MPSSSVTALLSGGVSVGILAGVVSGLFYLVVAGFRWAGEVRLHSTEWFQKQLRRHCSTTAPGDATDRSDGSIMESESAHVREFIERLVEALVTGGLDQVNVNRLYAHPECKPLDDSDSPSAVHAELKALVQRVIQEAMALPALQQGLQNGSAKRKEDIKSKTYEDILATAILNKVIERFQLSRLDNPEGTDANSNLLFKNRTMEQQAYITSADVGSPSSGSVDNTSPGSLEDTSWTGSSQTEPTSLTVEECFEEEEEVITYASSEEAEEDARETTGAELDFYLSGLNFIKRHRVPFPELGMDLVDGCEELEDDQEATSPQPTDLISPVDSWEENWLFQRRRLKVGGSHQPMPVPMLVPNPSEDYRALIGDQDAEETSDLSDCSEGIYEDVVYAQTEASCGTSLEGQRLPREPLRDEYSSLTDDAVEIAEARNTEVSSLESSSELGQQDSEYTEDYASVTQRQMGSLSRQHSLTLTPVPKPRTSLVTESCDITPSEMLKTSDSSSIESSGPDLESVTNFATPPRPGTIAEREHKKWESAPPLPNNPYSSENILKRINKSALLDVRTTSQEKIELPDNLNQTKVEKSSGQSQSDDNVSRYGRDYYVNASKVSSGIFGKASARPVEIVMSSLEDQPCIEIIEKRDNTPKKAEQILPCVGSTVSRWQKEINQREDLWLKNNNANRRESDTKTRKSVGDKTSVTNGLVNQTKMTLKNQKETTSDQKIQKPKEEISTNVNQSSRDFITVVNNSTDFSVKQEHMLSKVGNGNLQTNVSKTSKACDVKTVSNGDVNCATVNGKRKETDVSSVSSVTSSDNETIAMPSVKNLAKQFTARTNVAATSEILNAVSRHKNAEPFPASVDKKKTNGLLTTPAQPIREVHSLTARSISRVFREELKRNLPTQRGRHSHGSDSSHINGSDSSHINGSDSCLSLRSSSDVSTTPGYTSDESSGASPTPGSLRNNIAFWEQLQHHS